MKFPWSSLTVSRVFCTHGYDSTLHPADTDIAAQIHLTEAVDRTSGEGFTCRNGCAEWWGGEGGEQSVHSVAKVLRKEHVSIRWTTGHITKLLPPQGKHDEKRNINVCTFTHSYRAYLPLYYTTHTAVKYCWYAEIQKHVVLKEHWAASFIQIRSTSAMCTKSKKMHSQLCSRRCCVLPGVTYAHRKQNHPRLLKLWGCQLHGTLGLSVG